MTDTTHVTTFQTHLGTPSDLDADRRKSLGDALLPVTADVVALYFKTKNYHWHISGSHFKEYHELLDAHADQIFAMIDVLAERARKLGQPTIHSIGEISRIARVEDDDRAYVEPHAMIRALLDDEGAFCARLRELHAKTDACGDVATTSILETFIDETERRIWFLYETVAGA